MIRLSASAVPRGLPCPGSFVLPQSDYRTAYAEEGTEYHGEMDAAVVAGETDKLPEKVAALLRPDDDVASEMAYAYDVASDTGRRIGRASRGYAGAPYEVFGTVDLIARGPMRTLIVDYKSHERVEPAATNKQLATYALMVARAHGLDEIDVAIYYRGEDWLDVATLYAWDFDDHAKALKALQFRVADAARARRVTGADDPSFLAYLSTGRHCKYCPAFLSCPKQSQLWIEIGNASLVMRVESMIPFDDDVDAAKAFDLLGRITMLSTRLRAALYARAAERPIPLANGNMLGPIDKPGKEKLDGDIVYEVVKEQHGQAIADAAVIRSATKSRLKEALGFAGVKSIAGAERAVLDVVRDRGGSKRETKTTIEEYEPQRQLKEAAG